jgi:ubiquinone/menaquinone biosynthesis C-methylase UbiE
MNMTDTLLDLGTQPLVNNLCSSREESLSAKRYPLKAEYQEDLTIHLDTEISPDILYKNYLYHSGVSKPYIEHCKKMFESIQHLNTDVVIDVGGNDGTLLKTFKQQSNQFERLINVDASESFQKQNEDAGIEYICGFFNEEISLPKANIITSTNVFQHTANIRSFVRGVQRHLDTNGVWVLEFPYTLTTLLTLQFDQFYHEHYYYWLLTPLQKLFHEYGLKIVDISEQNIHGGTMRLWIAKESSSFPVAKSLEDYKRKEFELSLSTFDLNVKKYVDKSKDFILNLHGKTAFFGAAAKGCVFLNALEISVHNMPDSYVIDDTTEKQGLFFPGTGFEICNRQTLVDKPVDNIIILAHNFKDHIVKSLREFNFEGNIITMLPSVEISLV